MARITAFTDLAYGTHERQSIDLFRPADDTGAPLVLLVHGGGWSGGGRKQYLRTCVPMAEAGFAAATIGYRLLPVAWPEIAWDVLRGAAYLSEHAEELGIDASRAVTYGSSAGGHLSLCMQAWRDRWISEGVVGSAPEIIGTVAQCPVVIFPKPAPEKINRRALMNGHPHEDVSPMDIDVNRFRDVLVINGDKDETTPLEGARAFVERLTSAGVNARLEVIAGAGHGFGYDPLFSEHGEKGLEVAIPYIRKAFESARG